MTDTRAEFKKWQYEEMLRFYREPPAESGQSWQDPEYRAWWAWQHQQSRIDAIENALKTVSAYSQRQDHQIDTLQARVMELEIALNGMLAHSCVADAGDENKFPEDLQSESAALRLLEDT